MLPFYETSNLSKDYHCSSVSLEVCRLFITNVRPSYSITKGYTVGQSFNARVKSSVIASAAKTKQRKALNAFSIEFLRASWRPPRRRCNECPLASSKPIQIHIIRKSRGPKKRNASLERPPIRVSENTQVASHNASLPRKTLWRSLVSTIEEKEEES